jgi:hypothetical protein
VSKLMNASEEDEDELHKIRVRLSKLLKRQEPIESYFNRLSVQGHGRTRTPKPISPKIPRPNIQSYQTHPAPGYRHIPPPPRAHAAPAWGGMGDIPPPRTHAAPTWGGMTDIPPPRTHASPTWGGMADIPPPRNHAAPSWGGMGDITPPRNHAAPTWGGIGIGDIPFIPPPVPEIPQSPTYSSASSTNHSNDSGEPVAHWAMKIFDGRHSSTPFHTLAETTVCLGRDEPRVIEMLDGDGFEKVLELPFEIANVWVRLYWRSGDNRARILFLTKDGADRRLRYCFPLTGLKVMSTGSCLQLCRVNRKDGRLDLWARLRFTLYERR